MAHANFKYLRRDSTTGLVTETLFSNTVGINHKEVNATVALVANELVFIDAAGGADLASAAAAGNPACGFAATTEAMDDPIVILFEGIIGGFVGLTPGERQYLSDSAPGEVTSTPVTGADKLHQLVGKAISTTEILFEPDDAIALLA